MKTAFKILPEAGGQQPAHLLIEAGWEGISFVYYSKDPFQVRGLYIYHFKKNITALEIADELTAFFKEENLPAYTRCHICYNFKESTLVPSAMYKENMQEKMLEVIYNTSIQASCYAEKIEDSAMHNVYRVDNNIHTALLQQYPSAQTHHSSSLMLQTLKQKGNSLYCTVYQNSIKVFIFKDNLVQLVQFFEYTTPADVAYQLLNICQQHQMNTQELTLMLSGFIDKKSNLFDELFRYFLNIELMEQDEAITTAQAVSQYPAHFFSHLILLVKCVS